MRLLQKVNILTGEAMEVDPRAVPLMTASKCAGTGNQERESFLCRHFSIAEHDPIEKP